MSILDIFKNIFFMHIQNNHLIILPNRVTVSLLVEFGRTINKVSDGWERRVNCRLTCIDVLIYWKLELKCRSFDLRYRYKFDLLEMPHIFLSIIHEYCLLRLFLMRSLIIHKVFLFWSLSEKGRWTYSCTDCPTYESTTASAHPCSYLQSIVSLLASLLPQFLIIACSC